jgi:TetR/AcrR family transcriptional repressor of nem operon
MARPLEFDREEAIHKAMQLFLRQGYEGTSIEDLTTALGISRASLYNAFGDKHGLMLETLGCADRLSHEFRKSALGCPGSAREVIGKFLGNLAKRENPGCYFLTIGSELSSADPGVKRRVKAALEASRQLFREVLTRENRWTFAEVEAKSAALLGATVSILMLVRVSCGNDLTGPIIEDALQILD